MNIIVEQDTTVYPVLVEVIEHDCYESMDYEIEAFSYYQPSPQQIEEGTDHDETGHVAVCNVCGADMPKIDLLDYNSEPDYERED